MQLLEGVGRHFKTYYKHAAVALSSTIFIVTILKHTEWLSQIIRSASESAIVRDGDVHRLNSLWAIGISIVLILLLIFFLLSFGLTVVALRMRNEKKTYKAKSGGLEILRNKPRNSEFSGRHFEKPQKLQRRSLTNSIHPRRSHTILLRVFTTALL